MTTLEIDSMKLHWIAALAFILAVVAWLLAAGPTLALGEHSTFSIAGSVAWAWYPGPFPPPVALVRVEFWIDDEPVSHDIVCRDELAPVCALLEVGTPVLILGQDTGQEKLATHIGAWLMPSAAPDPGR